MTTWVVFDEKFKYFSKALEFAFKKSLDIGGKYVDIRAYQKGKPGEYIQVAYYAIRAEDRN